MCERSQNNGGAAKSLPGVKPLQNVKVSAGFDCNCVRKMRIHSVSSNCRILLQGYAEKMVQWLGSCEYVEINRTR
jgi:hypothetical protein